MYALEYLFYKDYISFIFLIWIFTLLMKFSFNDILSFKALLIFISFKILGCRSNFRVRSKTCPRTPRKKNQGTYLGIKRLIKAGTLVFFLGRPRTWACSDTFWNFPVILLFLFRFYPFLYIINLIPILIYLYLLLFQLIFFTWKIHYIIF